MMFSVKCPEKTMIPESRVTLLLIYIEQWLGSGP